MIKTSTIARPLLALAATIAVVPLAAKELAEEGFSSDHITISAPREQYLGLSPGTGAPIMLYTVSVKIKVGDLDPRTEPGWQALKRRISAASRQACLTLDRKIAVYTIASTCRTKATRSAMKVAGRVRSGPAKADALVFAVGGN